VTRHRTLVTLALAFALALVGSPPAWTATDVDGDGSIDGDCRPLDPAVHPGATDEPDLAFEDLNCDGIDGDKAKAVFVTPQGDNGGTGALTSPLKTIAAAIAKADTGGKDVYVAPGTYAEHVALETNVGIYGGYTPTTGARTNAEHTIIASAPEAVLADGDAGVVLQLLTLNGSPGSDRTAYGLRAIGGSEVLLEKVTATAAAAVAGDPGASPAPAQPGITGSTGQDGFVNGSSSCPGGTNGAKGPGAVAPSGGGNGGDGGAGRCTTGDTGIRGFDSAGASTGGAPGPGGTGGSDAGDDGTAGAAGGPGLTGANAINNLTLAGAGWAAAAAAAGQNGAGGKGGGGGGGGGGETLGPDQNACANISFTARGGGGGGGGSGGAGGQAGGAGEPGGGSFGVYLFDSAVVAVGSTIAGGNGGSGGDGGAGAAGGTKGTGGPGGLALNPACAHAGNGGRGGDGGAGGDGGPGGGGAGGPSAGIFKAGASSFVTKGGTLAAGSGGAGGRLGGTGAQVPTAPAAGALPDATQSAVSDFDGDGVTDVADACPAAPAATTSGCPARPAKVADPGGGGSGSLGDADGDGFPAGLLDCNDGDPAVNSHATEVPGNATDENCDGVAAPFPSITSGVTTAGTTRPRGTRFKILLVKNVPAGGAVQLRCRSKRRSACPFRAKSVKVRSGKANGLTVLPKARRKRGLFVGRGATLEVRITAPAMIGKVVRYKIVKTRFPIGKVLCLPPGAASPQRCS
jgi:hypothetical protein